MFSMLSAKKLGAVPEPLQDLVLLLEAVSNTTHMYIQMQVECCWIFLSSKPNVFCIFGFILWLAIASNAGCWRLPRKKIQRFSPK
jgi:hypothetical protein